MRQASAASQPFPSSAVSYNSSLDGGESRIAQPTPPLPRTECTDDGADAKPNSATDHRVAGLVISPLFAVHVNGVGAEQAKVGSRAKGALAPRSTKAGPDRYADSGDTERCRPSDLQIDGVWRRGEKLASNELLS